MEALWRGWLRCNSAVACCNLAQRARQGSWYANCSGLGATGKAAADELVQFPGFNWFFSIVFTGFTAPPLAGFGARIDQQQRPTGQHKSHARDCMILAADDDTMKPTKKKDPGKPAVTASRRTAMLHGHVAYDCFYRIWWSGIYEHVT